MKRKIVERVIVGVICSILIVRCFVCDLIVVKGDSMLPGFSDKDIVLITKIRLEYKRFDVIVINTDVGCIIKRIIGLPGETVQIKNGAVYIDDCLLVDDYVDGLMSYAGIAAEPIVLHENEYFVLGDNREISNDSRNEIVGIINGKQIVGIVKKQIVR